MELTKNIIVVGVTEGEGIFLLINQADIETEGSKCISVQRGGDITPFDNIGTPMTFNAFQEVSSSKSENIKALMNVGLSDDKIEQINSFLTHESR